MRNNDDIIVEFNYESNLIKIQGKSNELMKDIYIKDFLIRQDVIQTKKNFSLVIMENWQTIQMEQKIYLFLKWPMSKIK